MNVDSPVKAPIINKPRIAMIDALRGFALAGILLLHHIQHFNFYSKPLFNPEWLIPIDTWLWDALFVLIADKAFALFCLLFGFSYWIIYENAKKRGDDYFLRHCWRMALLVGFGCLHLLFFAGDILMMYAVLGLPLLFTRYMNNKAILIIGAILLFNPMSIYSIGSFLFGSEIVDFRMAYPKADMKKYLADGSFFELLKMNFQYGYQISLTWSWNVGRILIIPGMFFIGVYFAKTKSFTDRPLKFWYSLFTVSLSIWLFLYLINDAGILNIIDKQSRNLLWKIVGNYKKISITFSILAAFIILWRYKNSNILLTKFANFGRMGLTNYLLMSVIGSMLYYGWGFSLYKYCGTTVSLVIGVMVLMLQMKLSSYWLARYNQGPLENLWRKATWIGSSRNAPKDNKLTMTQQGFKQ